MKRRCFLLLEVLIALSILALAILPLMSLPFRFAKEEVKSLELMTLERVALSSFLDMQERLCKNSVPWSLICRRYKITLKPYEEKTIPIQLNKKLKGLYREKITLYSKKKEGKENPFYLVKIKLEYQRTDEKNKNNWHTFTYPLLVERIDS